MTDLEREALVASMGIDRILAGKPRYNLEVQTDALAWPKRAEALLLKFFGASEMEPEDPPDFDWEEASDLLLNVGEAQNEAMLDALPDDIQDEVIAAATRVIDYLQHNMERRVTKTTARVEVAPPEAFALDRFERQWAVAVDPLRALRAMAEGALDPVMVTALQEMFPALYEAVAEPGGLLDEALAAMKARRGENWDVTDEQDRMVKVMLQVDPIDFGLAADFAALGMPAAAPPAKPSPVEHKIGDELLPGQKQT